MTVPMMLFTNNASSRLYASIDAVTTSIRVQAGDGAKFPTVTAPEEYYTVTIEDRRSGQIEICKGIGKSGDTLTVVRGQEGTVAQSFAMGATVSNRLTAGTMDFLAHAGAQGPQGEVGPQGPIGPQGPPGQDSTVPGPQGPQGVKGDTGLTGPQGPKGDTGAPGPQGPIGNTGAQGPIGNTGPQGLKGDKGDKGDQGAQGPQGDKGDKGDQGAASTVPGPTGPQGAQGPVGPASTVPGPVGPQGPKGDTGPTGGAIMYVGDAPPAFPTVGQVWWESDTGNAFIYYDDGNTLQWVPMNVGVLPEGVVSGGGGGGNGFLVGSGAPVTQGNPGDMYLDVSDGTFYGPRASADIEYFDPLHGGVTTGWTVAGAATNELGVAFRPAVNAVCYGVRLFRAATATKTQHHVALWRMTGQVQLARELHTGEPALGTAVWVEHRFASPILLTAGQDYIASWSDNADPYIGQTNYYPKTIDGQLYFQGYYTATLGNYPATSYNSSFGVEPLIGPVPPPVWPEAVDLATQAELDAGGGGGGDGTLILDGGGAPSPALGDTDDYYVDSTNHVMYGPKGDDVVLATLNEAGPPETQGGNWRVANKYHFKLGGKIIGARFWRMASSPTLARRVYIFDASGVQLAQSDLCTETGVAGWFTVVFPTPLIAAVNQQLIFAYDSDPDGYNNRTATVADATKVAYLGSGETTIGSGCPSGFTPAYSYLIDPLWTQGTGEIWPVAVPGFPEAPIDGKQYARQDAAWTEVTDGGGGGSGTAGIASLPFSVPAEGASVGVTLDTVTGLLPNMEVLITDNRVFMNGKIISVAGNEYSGFAGLTPIPAPNTTGDNREFGCWFFVTADNATITGLKFYRHTGQNLPCILNVWDTAQNKIATATVTSGSATGWQTVMLETPVPVTKNAYYAVTQMSNTVAWTPAFFNNGYTNGPLTFPSDAVAAGAGRAGNGCYCPTGGASGFPSAQYNALWGYTDVIISVAGAVGVVVQNNGMGGATTGSMGAGILLPSGHPAAAGGGAGISGSGANNQVARWTGANTQTGDVGLVYDPNDQNGSFIIQAQPPHGQMIKFTPRSSIIGSLVITGSGLYSFDNAICIGAGLPYNTVQLSRTGSSPKWGLKVETGLLNLPHGTAPGMPVNGDVWTQTEGLYARINGTTVGPLGTGGGGGSSDWADITNKPSTFPPSTHTHLWAEITDKPTTFTPATHSHPISEVTNLQTSLDAKADTSALPPPATVAPLMNGTAAVGTTTKYAREDHRHPTDTGREPAITAGTTAQYWRGDKTWQAFPTIPADDVIGGIITISNTAPSSPAVGDVWIDTS